MSSLPSPIRATLSAAVRGVYHKAGGVYGRVDAGSGGAGDPDIDAVASLLHFEGANNSTVFTDSSPRPKTFTAVGGAVITTAQSVFGGSSLRLTAGARISTPANSDFNFGTGDFTLEARVRFSSLADAGIFGSSGNGGFDAAFIGSQIRLGRANTAWDSSVNFTRSLDTWYAVAWCRSGTSLRFFIDGVLLGTVSNNQSYDSASEVLVGTSSPTERRLEGWIDEVRATKGVARYTDSYTIADAPFPDA